MVHHDHTVHHGNAWFIRTLLSPRVAPINSPNEAKFRDGSFDRWDVDQGISVEWKMHNVYALPKNVESQVV